MLPSRIRVLFFNLSSPRLEWTRNCNYPGLRERLSNCAASQSVDFALKFQRETRPSIIVFKSQMRYKFLASQVAQSILELDELDEQVVLGVEIGSAHRTLEVEGEPLLDSLARHFRAPLGKVHKQDEVKNNGGGQNRIAAQEVNFDLHGIAHPSEDVEIVPPLFVVSARRVIIDSHFVIEALVELRIDLRLEDIFQNGKLALFLGPE